MISKIKIVFLIFMLSIFAFNCEMDNSVTPPDDGGVTISKIEEYNISVLEPSGLSLSNDNNSLWSVSDNTGEIYNLTLDGVLITTLPFKGEDLEGIAIDKNDNSLWIVQEGTREVINVSVTGTELSRHKIAVDGNEPNSGLEGICIDKNLTKFVINEKAPMLFAKLNPDFSINTLQELSISEDLSGITYDEKRDVFWIASDKSQLLMQWSPSKGLINSFELPFKKAEGIAINTSTNILYIVSDKTEMLYLYRINENN